MSDNWITLIPDDPRYVPSPERREAAWRRFVEMLPQAEETELVVSETIRFFDCGENFTRIVCRACGADVPTDWWRERMDEDHDEGFQLARYTMPCCGSLHTLDELVYEWPQGFARFALDAMNPNVAQLDDASRRELEEILGTPLRAIHQHI